jgi:predicted DNA-binding protein
MVVRHPEYPTSIRLSVPDKKRLRKLASKWQLSLAGLIQMIIKQWLESQDKLASTRQEAHTSSEPAQSEEGKLFIGAME